MSDNVGAYFEAQGRADAQNSAETGKKLVGRPFEKGDPRINRGGRPKKKWLTEVFEEMLGEKMEIQDARELFKEAMWHKLIGKGVVSVMLLEKMLDRTEGKLTQPVEVSGEIDITSIIEEGRKRAEGGS